MAVDTRNKRASVLQHSSPFGGAFVAPNPDGALANQADRQHMGWIYAGINVVPDLPVTGTRRRRRPGWGFGHPLAPLYTTPPTLPLIPSDET